MPYIVSVIPLDVVEDIDLLHDSFLYFRDHVLPRLGSGYVLGVATRNGTSIADSKERFAQAMLAANQGMDYDEPDAFGAERTDRIVAQLKSPEVCALWTFNGGRLKAAHKTKAVMHSLVKHLVAMLQRQAKTPTSFFHGIKGKMKGQAYAVGVYGQKPILGYCYGTAIMTVLALAGIGRPIHCPLFMDVHLWADQDAYDNGLRVEQIDNVVKAISGTLQYVELPMEPQGTPSSPAALRLFHEGGSVEGFVLAGLVQMLALTIARHIPRTGTPQPLIIVCEYLDFGDEPEALAELAEAHKTGKIYISALVQGYMSLKDGREQHERAILSQLHLFVQQGIPVFDDLELGHNRPNRVCPMGWGRLSFTPTTRAHAAKTKCTLDYHRTPDGNFEMLRKDKHLATSYPTQTKNPAVQQQPAVKPQQQPGSRHTENYDRAPEAQYKQYPISEPMPYGGPGFNQYPISSYANPDQRSGLGNAMGIKTSSSNSMNSYKNTRIPPPPQPDYTPAHEYVHTNGGQFATPGYSTTSYPPVGPTVAYNSGFSNGNGGYSNGHGSYSNGNGGFSNGGGYNGAYNNGYYYQ